MTVQLEQELSGVQPRKDMLLTIGVFDGVHLGHKYLIGELLREARSRNMLAGVVTFKQHPREVIAPETRLTYLTSLEEKVVQLPVKKKS